MSVDVGWVGIQTERPWSQRTLVAQGENGAARFACRYSKTLTEGLAEMGEVLEAPRMGDLGDALARLGGIEEVAPAAVEALMPDQIVNGAAGGADGAMQAALRGIQVFRNAVERQVRIAQMVRDVGTNAIAQRAPLGFGIAPPHLLVDGEIDDLGDRFCEHVRPLGMNGTELFDDPAGDPEHEPADTCGTGKRPRSELVEVDIVVQAIVRNQQHQA